MKSSVPAFMLGLGLLLSSLAEARVTFTSIGVSFLGTGLLSLTVERRSGDSSVRANIGFFDSPRELCLAVTANRYRDSGTFSPHIGAGLWTVLAITPKGIGHIDALTFPVGVDWSADTRNLIGAEADPSLFFGGRDPESGPMRFKKNRRTMFIALPALSWKYHPK